MDNEQFRPLWSTTYSKTAKLDRLSRSLRDVLTIMERMTEAKAGFRSLTQAIGATTPAGRMMMQMAGAFAEFERANASAGAGRNCRLNKRRRSTKHAK